MPKKSSKIITKKPVAQKGKIKEKITEKAKEKVVEVATTKTPEIRENTKLFKIIEMIKSSDGVTITELAEALKWQNHTVRSALSRLNKIHNIGIINDKSEGNGRLYKIAKKD